ncbi:MULTISPECIES: helix-turn-helix transcriptional regulator [Nostoc]|uniref:Helix-turn-helix domain-containing protein n=1 Tax=Nostoc paludosum FACHB-159 TaxID=2692908 RepID=A0ABR8KP18_9NOSO|nr:MULTISPECIES: helix-turn-helix domain-containing protein [Nostoc]MBD2683268.1 helix-turn-helix domain-containing protein [Nostoc sp. FACHB-857]MBD2739583.1 helix-turn-helix domain-containing protein [Nostoc paludosum FACHB-159]
MAVLITLKKVREAKGISQNDLARITGYSVQNIQKIEQGRVSSLTLDAFDRFCKALGCLPGDLLEYTPDDDGKTEVMTSEQPKIEVAEKAKQNTNSSAKKKSVGLALLLKRKTA